MGTAERAARRLAAVVAALGAVASPARSARADGAFPDSQTILTPADAAGEITLVTNFGLIASRDGGQTWLWSCEGADNAYGAFYQLGLGPRHRLYALVDVRVVFSDDRACGWTASGGLLAHAGAGLGAIDFWVDRTVPDRLLAVDVTCCAGGDQRSHRVIESRDGGATFDRILLQAETGATITGVESARSSPDTIYVTLGGAPVDGGPPPPELARTLDGGGTWRTIDLTAALGPGTVRLVGVDAGDPDQVFLAWSNADGEALAATADGGMTARKILIPSGVMKAFLRLGDGTILVAAQDDSEGRSVARLYRSRDGGATFESLAKPPHVRALSERAGTVFAATDNFSEGYAVGVSTDQGETWRGLLAYEDVHAILPCAKTSCQEVCASEVQLSVWPAEVCSADAPPESEGTGGAGGRGSAGGAAGQGGAGPAGRPPRAGGSSGGCQATPDATVAVAPLAPALLLLVLAKARRRP
ncbi:MAG TPA: sialidase family protein [Polyangia bacterium]